MNDRIQEMADQTAPASREPETREAPVAPGWDTDEEMPEAQVSEPA